MKPKIEGVPPAKHAPRDDEKMYNIVDEVDRFFKSVHADIEDWKFSMEDYGDGTRIFVRFQIHFDQSVVSPNPRTLKLRAPDRGQSPDSRTIVSVRGGKPKPEAATELVPLPDTDGAAQRADLDLASFVDLWRRKREGNLHGEFHKKGAPYVDGRPEGLHGQAKEDPTRPSTSAPGPAP